MVESITIHLLHTLLGIQIAEARRLVARTPTAALVRVAGASQLARQRPDRLTQRLERPRAKDGQILCNGVQRVNCDLEIVGIDATKDAGSALACRLACFVLLLLFVLV